MCENSTCCATNLSDSKHSDIKRSITLKSRCGDFQRAASASNANGTKAKRHSTRSGAKWLYQRVPALSL